MGNWRINIIFLFIIIITAAIISRLFYLQIFQYDYYKALATGQQKDFKLTEGERGNVFFKNGQLLATSIKVKYVFVLPKIIKNDDKEKIALKISEILALDKEKVLEKLNSNTPFEVIKKDISKEEAAAIKKENLSGVYIEEMVLRKYPQDRMASQIIGFLGGNNIGQYGIEGYYDKILRGKTFFKEKEKGYIGFFFDSSERKPQNGADIYLTVDYNVQLIAEKLLKKAKDDFDIEGGLIIVSEPNSGKILALAHLPNFNPNSYSEEKNFTIFQNSAIQRFYEPGSVLKVITMAAALNEKKITPQTTYVDEGFVKSGGYTISNYHQKVWGKRTMTEVLEKSINTGAIFAERQIGDKVFLEYLEKFGFFKPTNIDLQGEIFSENKEFKKGYEINFLTASFGQGIEITPIQLIRAFSAIANNGKILEPYIVEKIIDNGKIVEIKPKISDEYIISPEALNQLITMMISVVDKNPGGKAKIPGYYIAGKTGTSQVPYSSLGINQKGYSNKTWQSFIGFAPAFNPKFLILVKLDNPKTKDASASAAPIFRDMAKYLIDYFQIPPDYKIEE